MARHTPTPGSSGTRHTGKSITVAKTDVTGKGVLMCEVSK